jgi:hypothetical protein
LKSHLQIHTTTSSLDINRRLSITDTHILETHSINLFKIQTLNLATHTIISTFNNRGLFKQRCLLPVKTKMALHLHHHLHLLSRQVNHLENVAASPSRSSIRRSSNHSQRLPVCSSTLQ